MFVAPLSLIASPPAPHRGAGSRVRGVDAIPSGRGVARKYFLLTWAALGLLALIAVPDWRGSRALGATLPFWLVAAPLLDLLWLDRARWRALLDPRRHVRGARRMPAATRVVPAHPRRRAVT